MKETPSGEDGEIRVLERSNNRQEEDDGTYLSDCNIFISISLKKSVFFFLFCGAKFVNKAVNSSFSRELWRVNKYTSNGNK